MPRACPLPRDRDSPGCHSSSLCASRAVQLPNSAHLGNREPGSTAGQGRELCNTTARSLKRRAPVPPGDRGYNGRGNTSGVNFPPSSCYGAVFGIQDENSLDNTPMF